MIGTRTLPLPNSPRSNTPNTTPKTNETPHKQQIKNRVIPEIDEQFAREIRPDLTPEAIKQEVGGD